MSPSRYHPSVGRHSEAERRRTSPQTRALRDAQLGDLVRDIAARLRNACSHLPDAEFDALVLDMARMQMRFWDLEENLRIGSSDVPTSEPRKGS
jgi:hypothetical protein